MNSDDDTNHHSVSNSTKIKFDDDKKTIEEMMRDLQNLYLEESSNL